MLSLGAATPVPLYPIEMQRLFTMFPAGAPGLALVLLRMSVAGTLWETALQSGLLPSVPRVLGLSAASVLLLGGFATPLTATIAAVVQFARVLDPLRLGMFIPTEIITAAVHGVSALSLALLGPGAFSIDARRFGRRILAQSGVDPG